LAQAAAPARRRVWRPLDKKLIKGFSHPTGVIVPAATISTT
jgi:hypothetical protein